MCVECHAGIVQLYDSGRMKKTIKRTNPDKSVDVKVKWQKILWVYASKKIAGELAKLQKYNKAHKLLWVSEDHLFTHV